MLGVTGGIAAYKSVQLARDLTRLGAEVDVVLTRAATRFVGALSFQGVTGRPTLESLWSVDGAALHIQLARGADLVLVAPATADLMARAAHGRADDLLTTLLLATPAPVLVAPAMNDRMWAHPQTRSNAAHLREALGYHLAGPAEGPLAAGEGEGPGRMLDVPELVDRAGALLGRSPPWTGKKVVITAGPTREPIDPVRYVGNRSSGRMGFALAREAALRGAEVTVVTGPTILDPPTGVELRRVETAADMLETVRKAVPGARVVIYAAAVADYRPSDPAPGKRRKEDTGDSLTLELVKNPDIALDTRELRDEGAVAVGFALETENLVERAAAKMRAKGFRLMVANPAGDEDAGFEVDTNRVTLLEPDGTSRELPLMSKADVARRVLDRVGEILEEEGG